MKTGFVFDLDGTLVDSIPGIARGLNLALKALGYPEHSVDAIREMVGKGARELCLASLKGYFNGNVPEETFEAVHRGFMREYPHTWQEGTVPYPGIREMLLSLAGEGHPLGVLSNKPHAVTVPLVRHILPEIPFREVMGFPNAFRASRNLTPCCPSSVPGAGSRRRCAWWGTPPMTATRP